MEEKEPKKSKLEQYIKYYQIQKDIEEQSKLIEESDGFFDKFTPRYVKLLIFYALTILVLSSVALMTLQYIDSDYTYRILNRSFISAISPNQDINGVLNTSIIQVIEFDKNDIAVGDNVVVFGDYNIDEYWVEEITDIDFISQQVELTYDQVSTYTVRFDKIIGIYEQEANLFGTILYTAKFTRGYILIIASHFIILLAYYLGFLTDKE